MGDADVVNNFEAVRRSFRMNDFFKIFTRSFTVTK